MAYDTGKPADYWPKREINTDTNNTLTAEYCRTPKFIVCPHKSRNVNTNLSKVLKTSAGGNLKQLHPQQHTDILGLVVCR